MATPSTDRLQGGGDEAHLLADARSLGLASLGMSGGGRPIYGGLAAGSGPGRDAAPLIVVAGVHGDEPASVAAAIELWRALGSAPPPQPIWVLPVLNPDGIAAGTKNSSTGVDLNRNFPARDFTRVHEPGYDPGPAALSEPETRVLASLVESSNPRGVVAIHAPLTCVNYDGPAGAWAAAVAQASGWPVRADLGYPTPGSLGSWLGVDRGLPVLTLELPPGPYEGFRPAAEKALRAAINQAEIR
jgi:protein MpaA